MVERGQTRPISSFSHSHAARARVWWRGAAATLLALAGSRGLAGAAPRPVRVTIQDQPHFENARSTRVAGSVEVRAELRDDTGAPIAGADVELAAARPAGQRLELAACVPGRGRRGDAPLRTDVAGALCARVGNAAPDAEVELTFAGDALHLPAVVRVALEQAPSGLELSFETPSLELTLDQPTSRLHLRVAGTSDDEPIPALELELHEQGRTRPLAASEWSRAGDRLSFSIDSAQLGEPGPARLVARHIGRDRPVRAEAVALKLATVRLGAELVGSAAPGSAAELRVWAEPRGQLDPSGWVEVTREDGSGSLGSAPFEAGTALLRLAEEATSGELWIHYRSDDPWWRAGDPLRLVLGAPDTPREPRRWPWLALLAPIGYVCLRSLQRPAPRQSERRAPAPRRQPAAMVVESAAPKSGWVGTVTDAHDGHPIAGARVRALLPSFRAEDAATHSTITDALGGFRLPALPEPLPEGARLEVWSMLHSALDRSLPPQGRVSITLTSRRRAVLRRLVRWAHAIGSPWVRGGEPTPGEIVATALRRGERHTAQWADAVQAAAYGAAPVDEAREAALRAAEPPWRHGAPSEREGRDD
ncbi:MAG TPA: carboxypeptidase-like regulatory domain-containing protein [Polyangiaceae bacterium]|nr:carboxypeptidase-like regulatory domain-containing protein [Polyangiaceae bacterium]